MRPKKESGLMKYVCIILYIALLLFLFGCSSDVEFTTTIERSVHIHSTEPTYYAERLVDMSQRDDLLRYKDEITGVNVEKIFIKITENNSQPNTRIYASVSVADSNQSANDAVTVAQTSGLPLSEVLGTEIEIELDPQGKEKLNQYIHDLTNFKIFIFGSAEPASSQNVPLDFTAKIIIRVRIHAKVKFI
ncbi:MAG TPA: hypothetical protein ENL24_00330 [candidate division Zixibacteria bacterium]|nr:hypothetical protein [candidate division Zixibacteria bacterium]